MVKKEDTQKTILEDKIVLLKPIARSGKMIKKPDHIGYFMFNDASKNYVLPRDPKTGSYKRIFNEEELKFFGDKLQMDLSFTKKEDNFWDTYRVRITKTDALMKTGLPFDLSDPYQNIDYRIIKSLKVTAPSYKEIGNSPRYIWYIAEENEELVHEAKQTRKIQELWVYLGSIMNNKKKMIDLLSVYFAEKSRENEVDINNSIEWFVKEVEKLITKDPDFIMNCKSGNDYEIKALIIDGVRAGSIKKTGRNKYELMGDTNKYDYIALTKLVKNLKEKTDDDYIRLKDQIDKFYKSKK